MALSSLSLLLNLFFFIECVEGFIISKTKVISPFIQRVSPSFDNSFNPPDISGEGDINEKACADAAEKMRRINVPVPNYVSDDEEVGISFIHWPSEKETGALPLLLVHGFDSSCLEFRRLGPKLAENGINTYAVDLLGWGYSQLNDVKSFSAQAKVDALVSFWNEIDGGKVCVAGASLGGAAAIDFVVTNFEVVEGCVLIDAQGFTDGVGPMAFLPNFLAEAGVNFLKTVQLRRSANEMSYHDTDTFATDDALKVGRLHCLRQGWRDALVSFMKSGGFSPSSKVCQIECPTLVLWGKEDAILDISFAQRFLDVLPDAKLSWIEKCGHVPHLEQPAATANEISTFLLSDKFVSESDTVNFK